MLTPHQTRTPLFHGINWRLIVRLNLLLTLFLWAATLLPFYYWVMFRQTGRRRASVLWATQFLLKHGWRDLLKIAAAEFALSVGVSLISAMTWSTWVSYKRRKLAAKVVDPDINPGVWPPPPNVPEGQ